MMRGQALCLAAALLGPAASGQQGDSGVRPKGHVTYVAEPQSVKAGKRGLLEMRFHVDEGFHVNSHTPKSELLIPTAVTLEPSAGVQVGPPEYPAGTAYSFSFEPNEKLDVYSGDFSVKVPVTAAAGEHTMKGVLRYQACDKAACYPPKSLPVDVVFAAK